MTAFINLLNALGARCDSNPPAEPIIPIYEMGENISNIAPSDPTYSPGNFMTQLGRLAATVLPELQNGALSISAVVRERGESRSAHRTGERRWIVERFFAWIQWQHRLLVRWEYNPTNFLGFVQLAALCLLLKQL
jgi:hypothetical protein